jgi:hypothetical protein
MIRTAVLRDVRKMRFLEVLGLFFGPRCIGRYAPDGMLLETAARAA